INIPAIGYVKEIQIITIELRNSPLNFDVLTTIDKAIPSPIIFRLNYQDKFRYVASYKRPSEADKNQWVISHYFQSHWLPNDAAKVQLPVALDLDSLYQQILKNLIPYPSREKESIHTLVNRVEEINQLEREKKRLEARLHNEKQFNRQVDINRDLNKVKKEI